MLDNIFIINCAQLKDNLQQNPLKENYNVQDLSISAYVAYPDEDVVISDPILVEQILSSQKIAIEKDLPSNIFDEPFLYSHSKAIQIDGVNLLVVPLPHHHILGLVFDLDTNPYDYRNELIRLLEQYVMEKFLVHIKEKSKTNLLLTLFIDLRKYASESLMYNSPINPVMVIKKIPMVKVFVFGLDNAGKSSLMRLLATGKFDYDYFPPTKKFRITNVNLRSGAKLVCWDMPGQFIFREDWLRGAQASNILLFVLDVADQNRFDEAKSEFWNMVQMYDLNKLPLVFLANKVDKININKLSRLNEDIINFFELSRLHDRDWKIIDSSLPEHQGIDDLIQWMENSADNLLLLNGINI